MRHNKFFNEDIKNEPVKNTSRTNKSNNTPILSYIFLTILGVSCVIGIIYYALEFFSTK